MHVKLKDYFQHRSDIYISKQVLCVFGTEFWNSFYSLFAIVDEDEEAT